MLIWVFTLQIVIFTIAARYFLIVLPLISYGWVLGAIAYARWCGGAT